MVGRRKAMMERQLECDEHEEGDTEYTVLCKGGRGGEEQRGWGDRSISSQLTENKRAKEGLRILLSRLNDCSTTFRDRDKVYNVESEETDWNREDAYDDHDGAMKVTMVEGESKTEERPRPRPRLTLEEPLTRDEEIDNMSNENSNTIGARFCI
jgi:hypothetical protein